MPVAPRPDGLYDVTDEYGGTVLSEIPQEWLPPSLASQGSAQNFTPAQPEPEILAEGPGLNYTPGPPAPPPQATDVGGYTPGPGVTWEEGQRNMAAAKAANEARRQAEASPVTGQLAGPETAGPAAATSAGLGGGQTQQLLSSYIAGGARGSGGARREAEDVLQGYGIERQAPLSPESQAELEKATLGSALAQQYAGDTLSVAQREAGEQYAARREQAEGQLHELEQRRAQENAALGEQMSLVRERAKEAREARATFNPNAYWDDRGALGTFAARLGIAFGAIGSAITGGPNQVYQMVNDEIHQNVEGQRMKLEDVQAGFEAENSILAQMRAQFLSPEAAEAAARSLMAEAAAAQTLEVASAVGSQEALANSRIAVAKIQDDAAKYAADAERLEHGAIRETFKHVPAGVYGGQPGGIAGIIRRGKQLGITPIEAVQLAMGEAGVAPGMIGKPKTDRASVEQQRWQRSLQVRLPGGGVAYAADTERAKEAEKQINATEGLAMNYGKIRKVIERGVKSLSPADRAEAEALASANVVELKELFKLGVLSADDRKLVAPLTGEGAANLMKLDASTLRAMETAEGILNAKAAQARRGLTIDPEGTAPLDVPIQSREAD